MHTHFTVNLSSHIAVTAICGVWTLNLEHAVKFSNVKGLFRDRIKLWNSLSPQPYSRPSYLPACVNHSFIRHYSTTKLSKSSVLIIPRTETRAFSIAAPRNWTLENITSKTHLLAVSVNYPRRLHGTRAEKVGC